jgi:hypothetical protein
LRTVIVILASTFALQAASAEPAPTVGPIALDMSVDAAQKATPEGRPVVSPATGHIVAVGFTWTLEEQAYDSELRPRRYGGSTLALRSSQSASSAKACRKRVLALATHFGTFFSALRPNAGLDIAHETRTAGNGATVGEAESRASGDWLGEDTIVSWFFSQEAGASSPFGIRASAQYLPRKDKCDIAANIVKPPTGAPAFETLDLKAVKPIGNVDATRLSVTAIDPNLPKGGAIVTLDCAINRMSGRADDCFEGERDRKMSQTALAALRRVWGVSFDPAKLDPDNEIPLRAVFAVRVTPEPPGTPRPLPPVPVPLSPTVRHAPGTPVGPFVWTRVATPNELSEFYPADALAAGAEGYFRARCTVREDLSLSCPKVLSRPANDRRFDEAAQKVIGLFRVAPVRQDGQLAVGTEGPVAVRFQLRK